MTEDHVVPHMHSRSPPLWFSSRVLILDNNTHPHVPYLILGRTEDPDAGAVHLDNSINPFGRRERQAIDRLRRWHGIAIESNDGEAMARQGQRYVIGRTGVEQAKQHALSLPHADRFAVTKHAVVERRGLVGNLKSVVWWRAFADI